MRLVLIPLLLMMFTAVLYQSIAFSSYSGYWSNQSVSNSSVMGATVVENGSSTGAEMEGYSLTAGIDLETGIIAIIIASVAVAVVAGVTVLGSGLKDFSVKFVTKIVLFQMLWILFSVFALEAFELFPFGFGWMFYVVMTMVYSIGIVDSV